MSRGILGIVAGALVLIGVVIFLKISAQRTQIPVSPPAPLATSTSAPSNTGVSEVRPKIPVEPPIHEAPPRPIDPDSSAPVIVPSPVTANQPATDVAVRTELEAVTDMLREYRSAIGENPIGTNAEIMRAVMGDNVKQLKLTPPEGQRLNGKGELVDRWNTPYFFHQLSAQEMEIWSAGPDQTMGTKDDIRVK